MVTKYFSDHGHFLNCIFNQNTYQIRIPHKKLVGNFFWPVSLSDHIFRLKMEIQNPKNDHLL